MTVTPRFAGADIDQVHGGRALPIGARLGDFDVVAVLRQGSFGVVYEGVDRSSLRKVAIKEYLPAVLADRRAGGDVVVRSLRHQQSFREGMQGFLSEARTLAALAEPALVKVLHFWEQHGTAYMAMPLHEGRSLKDALRGSPAPGEAWLKGFVAPLLDALAALHGANIYPCDITPDHILLLAHDRPLVFDFGLTRRIIANASEDVTVVLRPGFAPIEQYVQDPSMPEGPWTDIYAVAAAIYFAITGKPPASPTARIVADTMPSLGDVAKGYSERFLDGVDRGLAVRPEHRPQTIAEFRAALGIAVSASGAAAIGNAQAYSPASNPDDRKVDGQPELGRVPPVVGQEGTRIRVLGDGTRVKAQPTRVPAAISSPASPLPATAGRVVGLPWKSLAISAIMVGLVGVGLLVWIMGEPRNDPPVSAGNTASAKLNATQPERNMPAVLPPVTSTPVPSVAERSTQVATAKPEPRRSLQESTAPATDRQADAAAGVPGGQPAPASKPPGTAGSVSPRPAASGAGPVTSVPPAAAASVALARPAPQSGKIQLSIKPWGEILVDGKARGVSPPIKELSIPEGRHRIEIRNSTFPGYASEIDVKAGSNVSIAHTFKSP